MEFPDFDDQLTLSDFSLWSASTPEFEFDYTEWTYEENKMFEKALAEFDPTSSFFFENVASKVPWKTIEQIKKHYEALVEDLEMIESGHVPIPNYPETDQEELDQSDDLELEIKDEEGSSSRPKKANANHPRRKGVPWTEEEHRLFLMGLHKYGKGDWRSISRHYVVTKNPTQVASHAQKFFRRKNSSTPVDRRRPSIHDIQSVNSTSLSVPQRHRIPQNPEPAIPMSTTPFGLPNMYNYNPNPNPNYIINGTELNGNVFQPVSSAFSVANSMTNQPSGDQNLSSLRLNYFLGNQTWG